MTPKDWKILEDTYGLYSPVHLICDGFKITLEKGINHKNDKLYNVVYVNGKFKGLWLQTKGNHPESKFMYEAKKTIRTNSEIELKKLRRIFGKEKAKIFEPKTVVYLVCFYPSFSAFKKRIISNCTSIEIDIKNQ